MNLSLLIDTGSGDVVLNPGIYVPGKTSQNLNLTFENTYGTTSSNGTGNGIVRLSIHGESGSRINISGTGHRRTLHELS